MFPGILFNLRFSIEEVLGLFRTCQPDNLLFSHFVLIELEHNTKFGFPRLLSAKFY